MPEFGFEGYLKYHPNATLKEYDDARKAVLKKYSAKDPKLHATYDGCVMANMDQQSITEANEQFKSFIN